MLKSITNANTCSHQNQIQVQINVPLITLQIHALIQIQKDVNTVHSYRITSNIKHSQKSQIQKSILDKIKSLRKKCYFQNIFCESLLFHVETDIAFKCGWTQPLLESIDPPGILNFPSTCLSFYLLTLLFLILCTSFLSHHHQQIHC